MNKQKSNDKYLKLLSFFANTTYILDLRQLMDKVIEEVPRLLNAAGCSIYLIPELVQEYDGTLLDKDLRTIVKAEDIPKDFIVLAASSRPNADKRIGKSFYPQGEGLTGWVFQYGKPLLIKDVENRDEITNIASDLRWSDRYSTSKDYYERGEKKSILIVPLIADARTIGILKIPATKDKRPFAPDDENVATIVAQIIAGVIKRTWLVYEQGRRISKLVEISAKEDPFEVFESVTESVAEMLNCECRLYLRNADGSDVSQVVEDGRRVAQGSGITYRRGEGLVGWVFQTGKPLLLHDVQKYLEGQRLSDANLADISEDANVNEEDRFLKCEGTETRWPENCILPFVAVPIKDADGSVNGVLTASCAARKGIRRITAFSRGELQLAQSFASTISLAIDNERERRLGKLLTDLSFYWNLEKLFEVVISEIPRLISGSGCCLYSLVNSAQGAVLRLVNSSRKGLFGEDGNLGEVSYRIGEGKTGFCALAESTLVVNHFGSGMVSHQGIENERQRIVGNHPGDAIESLLDETGREVGLVQLRRGLEAPREAQKTFAEFAKSLVVGAGEGLPSPKFDQYSEPYTSPSWSFVAVPIKREAGSIYGVITMGRPAERNPFSAEDVTFFESIARRLSTLMQNLQMQRDRERLMMTLAHEINTPLTGILADTENLMMEAAGDAELVELSRHNLEQARRLHLLTETIMAVLSGETPARAFSLHSIYRPLKEAIALFESEAKEKGCDILSPHAVGSGFPDIEMSLFDLTLAFKNIIHNAVKYSFKSPQGGEANRYVRIVGRWVDDSQYSIRIQNYGVGILKEEIENGLIFRPYQRGQYASDRRRTGAGFGLAHARQIIEDLHHGSIEVTSKPLSGDAYLTTFVISLPVKQSAASPEAESKE